jgi:hypothetical protein
LVASTVSSFVMLTGCAGIYAEAGVSVLPRTAYSVEMRSEADAVQTNAFQTTSALDLAVGAEFDLRRRWRVAAGYQETFQNFGPTAGDSFGGADARVDFTLASLSEELKLRGAVGLGFGEGVGTASVPTITGGRLVLPGRSAAGGDAMVGIGLSWFVRPYLALHFVVGPDLIGSAVPGGTEVGIGGTARVAISLSFGDTRPNSTVVEKEKSHLNVMPAVAAGARKSGCNVENAVRETWAGVSVVCPQDPREIRFFQTAEGVVVMCSHRSEYDCRHRLDTFLDALGRKTG